MKREGFTLIELLIVVVIIGILIGMLTPALLHARRNARREQAKTDVNTLASAIRAYRHEYGWWPYDVEKYGHYECFTNNNWEVIEYLKAESLLPDMNPRGLQFMNLVEYKFLGDNIVDPNGRPYVITMDLSNDVVTVATSAQTLDELRMDSFAYSQYSVTR